MGLAGTVRTCVTVADNGFDAGRFEVRKFPERTYGEGSGSGAPDGARGLEVDGDGVWKAGDRQRGRGRTVLPLRSISATSRRSGLTCMTKSRSTLAVSPFAGLPQPCSPRFRARA